MAAILSVTVNKTDKNDACGIADAMRCHHYKETKIRREVDESMSILLGFRATLGGAHGKEIQDRIKSPLERDSGRFYRE